MKRIREWLSMLFISISIFTLFFSFCCYGNAISDHDYMMALYIMVVGIVSGCFGLLFNI